MHKYIRFSLYIILLLNLSGCGLLDHFFLPEPEETAQEIFESGMNSMEDKEYSKAADYFNALKDRYPFSPYAIKAELALGDAYFYDEEYPLAADAYKEFEMMHPKNENTPYVLFQIGLSCYKQFKSLDLRQENIAEGIEYFRRVTTSFPESEYAAKSQDYISKSRRKLAEHELYVADFYRKNEQYGPAWKRYTYVVNNFAEIEDLYNYAKQQVKFSYFEYQRQLSEEERREVHGGFVEWFLDWL